MKEIIKIPLGKKERRGVYRDARIDPNDTQLVDLISDYIGTDTRRSIADKMGISESMIYLLLMNRRRWVPKYIISFSKAVGLNASEEAELHKLAAKMVGYKV